jgi:hypothetical protein
MTAIGMTLISERTTPPGGVSATTGAVGSGGGGSLCTGLGGLTGAGCFLGGGTQSVDTAVAGGGGEASAGGNGVAGAVSVLSSVAGAALVAAGGSNEVLGVGPGLLFKLPHADNTTAAVTHVNRLAARIYAAPTLT